MCATHAKAFERSFEPLFIVHSKKINHNHILERTSENEREN